MYSPVLIASARMVQVQFLSACETNGPASATNTFFASCAWQYLLSTDLVDDAPARLDAVTLLLGRHRAERRPAHLGDDGAEGLLHVLDLLVLVVAPLEVEAQHRDAPFVDHRRVELAVGVRVRNLLAAAGEVHRGAVQATV